MDDGSSTADNLKCRATLAPRGRASSVWTTGRPVAASRDQRHFVLMCPPDCDRCGSLDSWRQYETLRRQRNHSRLLRA